jgi:hypothetical protein
MGNKILYCCSARQHENNDSQKQDQKKWKEEIKKGKLLNYCLKNPISFMDLIRSNTENLNGFQEKKHKKPK